jgi:hypothetical protein
VFEESGFVVVREHGLWLAFRCGPAAPEFLPPHAHADALSVQVWWRGQPVIVDGGSSTYESGAVRAWERSTAAHSTIRVDGRDQFRLWGAFRSGPLPTVRLRYARAGAVEASVVLPRRIRHVRRVEWDAAAGEVLVYDSLEGRGSHRVESRVLWSPTPPPHGLDADGVDDVAEEQAWTSDGPGHRVETTATVLRARRRLPARLGWRLLLGG